MENLLYKDQTYKIRGAIFDVYKEMGCGFLEAVYQECLAREFFTQKIEFIEQAELPVKYKGNNLNQIYKPDFVCYGKIIVEIKAVSNLNNEHRAQLHNYLKVTGMKLGLLVNFGN